MTFNKDTTTVTFNGVILPADYKSLRHQNRGISGNGAVRVYDRSVLEEFITIAIKEPHSNLTNIRNFINTTIKHSLESFTFTPDSAHNVGNGDGGAITVRYWDPIPFKETQGPYHKYKYVITLRREI